MSSDNELGQGVQVMPGTEEYERLLSDPNFVAHSPCSNAVPGFPSKWELQGFIGDASGPVVDLTRIMRIPKRK